MERPAAPPPAAQYRDPAVYERERAAVFGREWLVFARADQLPGPGRYVARVLAGYPVVVLRDDDGELRGFHNVCRHRAGPLVDDGEGTCRGGLVCRYHGWAYGHDGALARARDFGAAEPAGVALWPVGVAAWAGLVWVHLGTGPSAAAPATRPFTDDLASFVAEADGFPLEHYRFREERVETLQCNWKTYVDNYLEGYHIPLVHPALHREIDTSRYEVTTHDRYCIHTAPARDGAHNLGKWMWRWPNLAFNLYRDGMNVERIEPLDAATTRIVYTFFFTDGVDEGSVAATMAMSTQTLAEDRAICEAVQRNLDAGVYERGELSPRHEHGLAQFHSLVRTALGTTSW